MIQKLLLTAFLLLASIENICAQIPSWKWAKSATGNEYDQASSVATDASGNIFVAGYFASDSITLGSFTLPNSAIGFDDAFIAKYDSAGNVLWAHSIGGISDEKGFSVATDASGNVYLAGNFYSPSITIGTYTFTNAGNVGDIFIVKYDTNGNILWATKEGGPGLEMPFAIHADGSQNITVTGRFSSNSVTFGTYTLLLAGSMDVFIVRYDAAGNVLWAKGAGGGSNDEGYALDVDAWGNILVAGYFNQNALFGTITLSTTGISDAFLAKYDASGNVIWAKKAGGNGDDRAKAMAVDATGNIFVTGYFTNDSISFGNIVLPNAPGENSYISKYDSAGNILWAHRITGDCKPNGLVIANNSVYACGFFNGDTLTYGSSSLFIDGSADFFLVNCDFNGNPNWVMNQTSGGSSNEFANTVASDSWGNVIISGAFDSDPITFGPSVLSNTGNGFDMFVAQLGAGTTSINQLLDTTGILIYPNPAKDRLILYSGYEITGVKICTLTGKLIYSNADFKPQNKKEINTSNLPGGIYLLKMISGTNVICRKIVIEHN